MLLLLLAYTVVAQSQCTCSSTSDPATLLLLCPNRIQTRRDTLGRRQSVLGQCKYSTVLLCGMSSQRSGRGLFVIPLCLWVIWFWRLDVQVRWTEYTENTQYTATTWYALSSTGTAHNLASHFNELKLLCSSSFTQPNSAPTPNPSRLIESSPLIELEKHQPDFLREYQPEDFREQSYRCGQLDSWKLYQLYWPPFRRILRNQSLWTTVIQTSNESLGQRD